MCGVIDDIASQGVFQLAIGGGEPFLRLDLGDIVRYATDRGLIIHVTTGQYIFKNRCIEVLQHIKSLHLGIRSESLIIDTDNTIAKLNKLVGYAAQSNTFIGANLILTRFTINYLYKLVELLASCGFQRLVFLRYKPIQDSTRWKNENPGKELLHIFKDDLLQIRIRYPQLTIRLDCASAFLMRNVDRDVAIKAGIKGCVAGDRTLFVSPDGSVYPCSQLVGMKYKSGDLTQDSLGAIWRESDVLNRYRKFRQNTSFENSACGQCAAKDYCGGCRIFAIDSLGGEANCPLG
jgi:radical SAM protein with 4Fe4S-binding SPASM domain